MSKRPHDGDDGDDHVDDINMNQGRPPLREAHWPCEVCGQWRTGSHGWVKQPLNGTEYWMCDVCAPKFAEGQGKKEKEHSNYIMMEKKDDKKEDDNDGGGAAGGDMLVD